MDVIFCERCERPAVELRAVCRECGHGAPAAPEPAPHQEEPRSFVEEMRRRLRGRPT